MSIKVAVVIECCEVCGERFTKDALSTTVKCDAHRGSFRLWSCVECPAVGPWANYPSSYGTEWVLCGRTPACGQEPEDDVYGESATDHICPPVGHNPDVCNCLCCCESK